MTAPHTIQSCSSGADESPVGVGCGLVRIAFKNAVLHPNIPEITSHLSQPSKSQISAFIQHIPLFTYLSELHSAQADLEAMKKQAQSTNAEYDRLAEQYQKLQV